MKLQVKAHYNLLRQKWLADPAILVEPWQVEDYREASTHQLFDRVANHGVSLTEENFRLYAEDYDSPEDLIDFLWTKEEDKEKETAYLLLFEIWRRFLPEKQSLSLFCDELDARIDSYEKEPKDVSNILIRLEEILEENTDEGGDPKKVFASLSKYCVHDLESFLYDYISDQNETYATELLDIFYDYLSDTNWFDFLRAKLLAKSDPHEANVVLKSILDELKEDPDLDLLLEMAAFLVHHGDPHLFHQAAREAFALIETEEDLQELLAIVADYYESIDRDKEARAIQSLFAKRTNKKLDAFIDRSDQDVLQFESFLEDADWSKV